MRTPWAGAALLAMLGASGGAARASLEAGAVAPDFEGKEFVNAPEGTSLKHLRGRVVLLEMFRTW